MSSGLVFYFLRFSTLKSALDSAGDLIDFQIKLVFAPKVWMPDTFRILFLKFSLSLKVGKNLKYLHKCTTSYK